MPPVECVITFLPAKKIPEKEISFPNLYNLKLDMLENKKKLAKLLPPIPSWAKTKPPPPETKKSTQNLSLKKERSLKKEPTKGAKDISKEPLRDLKEPLKDLKRASEKPKSKKIIEESLEESETEQEEESEEVEDGEQEAGSEEEEEEGEDEEGEDEEEEEEESGEDNNSIEESEREDQIVPSPQKELSREEKLKSGYTENLTPEEQEKREKVKMLKKYNLLKYRLRQKYDRDPQKRLKDKIDNMINLGEEDSIELITQTYEKEIFELKIISSTHRYKQLLFMGFAGTEALVTQFAPSFDGFTKFHYSNADEYEELLLELGGEGDGFIENMSPFGKLTWAISMNTISFVVAKNMGGNASDFLSVITGRKAEPVSAPKIHLD